MKRPDLKLCGLIGEAIALLPKDEILSEITASNNGSPMRGDPFKINYLGVMDVRVETFVQIGGVWRRREYQLAQNSRDGCSEIILGRDEEV